MPNTITVTRSYKRGSEPALTYSKTISAEGEGGVNMPIPDGSSNLSVAYALDVTQAKVILIVATRDMTVKTNSSSTPDATIPLKANNPVLWHEEDGQSENPFGAVDVTGLFVSNASGADGNLIIKTDSDPTV